MKVSWGFISARHLEVSTWGGGLRGSREFQGTIGYLKKGSEASSGSSGLLMDCGRFQKCFRKDFKEVSKGFKSGFTGLVFKSYREGFIGSRAV